MNIWVQSKRNVSRPSWTEPPKRESKVAVASEWKGRNRRRRRMTRRSNSSSRRPHCLSASSSPKCSRDVWTRRFRCLKDSATPPSLSIILWSHRTSPSSTEHTTNRSTKKTTPCQRTTRSAKYFSKIATSSSANKLWNLPSSTPLTRPAGPTNGGRRPKKRDLWVRVEQVLQVSLRRKRSPSSCLYKWQWTKIKRRRRKVLLALIPSALKRENGGLKRSHSRKRAAKTRSLCWKIRKNRTSKILRN